MTISSTPRSLTSTLSFLACIGFIACAAPQETLSNDIGNYLSTPDGYELVWADEFDTQGLPDAAKWDYDTSRNKDGWWNEERQYYAKSRSQNARTENGYLIIEARKDGDQLSSFPDYGGQEYSSARLFTKGKASWKYGYFEMRAKLPCGRGLWPAIWTLPEDPGQWPDSGEIDIMEYVGHDSKTFHATVHTRDYNHIIKTQIGDTVTIPTACSRFHTHSLLWTPKAITVALDGRPYFRYENDGKGHGSWPFDQAHHIILNIAVGGTWGGQKGIDAKAFPAQMEVDYVRVYQSK
ncbi:MAG: glycoside hydrolase family 16 protein [Hellea sp.]